MNTFKYPEDRTLTLWTATAVGLGIAVHRIFFLVAAMIVAVVPFGWLIDSLRETAERRKHRHA